MEELPQDEPLTRDPDALTREPGSNLPEPNVGEAVLEQPGADALPELAGYRIESKLGEGGFGVVYKAWQPGLDRPVAIKMLRPETQGRAVAMARLLEEARTLSRLSHDHIVRILHIEKHKGSVVLILEFMEGGDLQKKLRGKPLPPHEAARIAQSLADALEAAHANDIVHRDIKPSNILLERADGGRAKISDFGLARLGDGEYTRTSEVMGSPGYMSPEQAAGRTRDITAATDIYSLGAVLYTMLTGRAPFVGDFFAVMEQVKSIEPEPIRKHNPQVPADLVTICHKCMEKEAGARFGSAAALREELGRFLRGEPLTIKRPGQVERLAKWARRKPVSAGLYAAAGTAVLFAGFGSLYFHKYHDAETLRRREVLARGAAEVARSDAFTARDRERQAKNRETGLRHDLARLDYIRSVDLAHRAWKENHLTRASELLAECPEDLRNWEWRYVDRLCHDMGISLNGHGAPVIAAAFSPDSQTIATAGGQSIRLWKVESGEQTLALNDVKPMPTSLAFADGGRRLVGFAQREGVVLAWDAASGKAEAPVDLKARGHKVLDVSLAGDRYLVQLADRPMPLVAVCKVSTGDEVTRFSPKSLFDGRFSADGQKILVRSWGPALYVYSALDGLQNLEIKNGRIGVANVAASPQTIALSFLDGTISFWNAFSGEEIWTCKPHGWAVNCMTFGPDGTCLTGSWDSSSKLLDVKNQTEIRAFRGHVSQLFTAAISPDGRHVFTGGNDAAAILWDAARDQALTVIDIQPYPGLRLAISRDGRRAATCSSGGSGANVWDVNGRHSIAKFSGHKGRVNAIAFDRDEKAVFTGGDDGTIRLWKADSGTELRTFGPVEGAVTAIALNPNVGKLVAGTAKGAVYAFNVAAAPADTAAPIYTGTSPVADLRFNSEGNRLAITTAGGPLVVLDAATWEPLPSPAESDHVYAAAFFAGSNRLAVSIADGSIRVLNFKSGAVESEFKTGNLHDISSKHIRVTPDGRRIVCACSDNMLKLWDVSSGRDVLTLQENGLPIDDIAISADGTTIAATVMDGKLRVWRAR
ncbi:MAG: hypothetical protein JWL69_4302 [Phycisphaerales bacterium]|nr:hypothetical protein [Phycisphaerales bacterium]